METREISPDTMQDLLIWLKYRENDIADGIEDFGELRTLFFELYGRNAGEEDEAEPCW